MGKRRILLLVVLAFTLIATCLFIGCGGSSEGGGGDGGDDTPIETYEVVLDQETMLLTLGDEGVLTAEPSEIKEGLSLTYTSSDSSVVSVDDLGKLTALKTGTATITVRYGEASATCLVTVNLGGQLPSLQMTNVTEDELYIEKATEIDLSCTVLFNGKTYEDVTVTYELSDDTVGEIEDGKFTPLAAGVTEISVIATWRGMTGGEEYTSLKKTITIEVVAEFVFLINDGAAEITIYTQGDDSSSPFVVTATYDGEDLATTVEITEGSDYIEYDETAHTVTSKGVVGEAEVTVTYTLDGENVAVKVPVHVLVTVYNYDGTVENFSAIHGDAVTGTDLATAFGGNFTSAKDSDGTALTVENNKVYGVKTSKTGKTEKTITLYNDSVGYNVAIEGYSGIFTVIEDFEAFMYIRNNANVGSSSTKISADIQEGIDAAKCVHDGYYVLANDIDATGYTRPEVGCQGGWRSTKDFVGKALGLTGTFDGQGHVISNLTMTNLGTGIFELVNGGTIKNLAITNLKSDGTQYLAAFSYIAIDPVIENVYIHIDGDYTMIREYALCSILHQTTEGAVQLKNVYFDCNFDPSTVGKAMYGGMFGTPSGVTNYDWENVYAVSNVGFNCTISKANVVTAYGYAENEKTGNEYNLILPEGRESSTLNIENYYRCGGAYYYASVADLKAANHDFSAFDAEYWTIVDGVPVWNGLGE